VNREIKFRAFNKKPQGMIVVSGESSFNISFGNEKPILHMYSNSGDHIDSWSPDFVMQYTGLNDKNGVEIYEGDIVSKKYSHCVEVAYIKFLDGMFVGYFDHEPDSYFCIAQDNEKHEVIGNIYENPELLQN
jgi:uncharacterized phage protein (TIGR01671 family)